MQVRERGVSGRSVRRQSGLHARALIVLGTSVACLLALGAVALGAVALAATKPPHKAGLYSGSSAEGESVTFRVSSSGTSIESFKTTIGYNGKCGAGGGPGFFPEASRIPIKRGRFSIAVKFKGEVPSVSPVSGKITGKFSGTTVTGTVTRTGVSGCNGYSTTYVAKRK